MIDDSGGFCVKTKIGVISPSPQFTALARKVAAQLGISVLIEEGALTRGLTRAKKMIAVDDVNTIVARGSTATLLKEHLDIPVVKVNVTNFDLLKALRQAKKDADEVVLLDHVSHCHLYDLPFIEELLSMRIVHESFHDEKEIVYIIKQLALDQAEDMIVGTAQCLANTAINRGIRSLVVPSSPEAIVEALQRAQEISAVYEEEKLRQHHLETIISYVFNGVIATDQAGKVTVFNNLAAKMLGVHWESVRGEYLHNVQFPQIKKLLGDGSEAREKIVSLGRSQLVVNRIKLKGQGDGAVITFQEVDEVMQQNAILRSELYKRRFYAKYTFDDIRCASGAMQGVIAMAKKYAQSDSNVLVTGESGTGKELMAQSIHSASARQAKPFIAVNCAALPENLLESELFGYEEGAFTGAKKGGKPGLFEMAHGGTVFLDEIGDLPLALQARLLRVLQEKEVMRIGGDRIVPVDVRVISATNKDLIKSMQQGNFRVDLFYRLNILQIHVPPLRERKDDIPLLVQRFLAKNGAQGEVVDEKLMQVFTRYDWPGNVRELENVVERLVALEGTAVPDMEKMLFPGEIALTEGRVSNGIATEERVRKEIAGEEGAREDGAESEYPGRERGVSEKPMNVEEITVKIGTLKEMEQQIIRHLVARFGQNRQVLADQLGISRTTLWKKVKTNA